MVMNVSTSRKARFTFDALQGKARVLRPDDTGSDVHVLQAFLTANGYLGRDRSPGSLCSTTCDSLRHFQKCHGLDDTGIADEDTLELIQRPRCGVPDIGPDPTQDSGPAPFVLSGCQYNQNQLTYAFINSTPDLSVQRQRDIIREAFAAWAAASPLRFTEVAPDTSPDFPIAFEHRNHGDGFPFDDAGTIQSNTLAHAFFPPPCGGGFAGALHFDEFENWTDAAQRGAIRLLNVAIHEIGHLLGLRHSNTRNAIMFAFYDDNVDSLRQDDINGIQSLYGSPANDLIIFNGELARSGDSQTHRLQARPGRLTATLTGPNGQDFDLYVRRGAQPSRSVFDGRGFSGSANERVGLNVTNGDVFVTVDSWRGSGTYKVEVEIA